MNVSAKREASALALRVAPVTLRRSHCLLFAMLATLAACAADPTSAPADIKARVQLDVLACQDVARSTTSRDAQRAAFIECMSAKGYSAPKT